MENALIGHLPSDYWYTWLGGAQVVKVNGWVNESVNVNEYLSHVPMNI